MNKVAIIGGGPAGMMAAYTAKTQGVSEVVLFERNRWLGQKLALTGGGRCNLTHTGTLQELAKHYHQGGKFLLSSLSRFDNKALEEFFLKELTLETFGESDGRVFPKVQSGKAVVDSFSHLLTRTGVDIRLNTPVSTCEFENGRVTVNGEVYDQVVVCTGGITYPQTGSTGWGLELARRLGHTVTSLLPGLTGIPVDQGWPKALSGVRLSESIIRVLDSQGKESARAQGELLFTHFGLSGPAPLNVSRWIAKQIEAGTCPVSLYLDLLPQLNLEQISQGLRNIAQEKTKLQPKNLLKTWLPEAVALAILTETKIDLEQPASQLSKRNLFQLAEFIKAAPLEVSSLLPVERAQVTVGGISLKEIDPKTLQSRLIPTLYFAGEILDIDGDTGGYNLQAAFSTGHAVGEALARG